MAKSRWGKEEDKVRLPGLPTQMITQLSNEQLKQYLRVLRIEEITQRLRTNHYFSPDSDTESETEDPFLNYGLKSADISPEEFKRVVLEQERQVLVEEAQEADPLYRAPSDFKKPNKLQERVYIPSEEFPELNFIGLLIGPRGHTMKKIEKESGGAKISIRGKGAHKEGKMKPKQEGDDEEIHALVMGDAEEKVRKAVKMVNGIIMDSCSIPDEENELKKQQLRELAALNGTILESDLGEVCTNCGQVGHKRFECPQKQNVNQKVQCPLCKAFGHLQQDCLQKNNLELLKKAKETNQELDQEYERLMEELVRGEEVKEEVGVELLTWMKTVPPKPWHNPALASATGAVPPEMSAMGAMGYSGYSY